MSLISQHIGLKQHQDKPSEQSTDAPQVNDAEKKRASKRKKMLEFDQDEEMKRLEGSLFGTLYKPIEFGTENDGAIVLNKASHQSEPLFFVDKSADDDAVVFLEDMHTEQENEEKQPAWVDDEEERTEVDILHVARLRKLRKEAGENVISGTEYVARLRAQHAKLNPGTDWAAFNQKGPLVGSSDDESEDGSGITISRKYEDADEGFELLRDNDELVLKDSAKLLPGLLEFSRLVDVNAQEPSNGPINSVQFHRNGQLVLTGGLDRRVRFFQVDGKRNPLIQSVFVEDCPVRKAAFLPDGSEVIIAGRRKFFYSFDLVNAAVSKVGPLTGREEKSLETFELSPDSSMIAFIGNEGYILLVSTRTKELVGTLKMNGTVRSLAFTAGGRQLVSSGGDGHVYHWDLRTRRCVHKGVDEGSLTGTSLCASLDGTLFASGSTSGIVNVYNTSEFLGGKRKPVKTIDSLTTVVNQMKFNGDAQILAICSRMKKNALRLVHVPSFTVFSNWPGRANLKYPQCLDFSPGGGFFTVGNAAGNVLLYKLHHYQNA